MSPRQLNLNLFIYPNGHHEAAWRHPDSQPERVLDISFYQDLAKKAEAAKFDALFFADALALPDNIRYASRFRLEPITWIAGLAAVTEEIGFIGTASTTYFDPFNLARLFASLDHLSKGRVGWNIVSTLGLDLSGHDLDAPFPRHLVPIEGDRANHSRFKVVLDIIDREQPTIRQLMHKLAGARGHRVVAGTPEQIADDIQLWFENGAADGFNIMPPYLPGGFETFASEVVPILKKRGLFREEYSGSTLRDHLGLERPRSQYAEQRRISA